MDTSKYDETEGFKQGLKVRREVLGDQYVKPSIELGTKDEFTHKLQQFVTEYCWGTVWCRDGLDRKTRSTINIALLAALGRSNELKLHVRGAINNGLTKEEIREVLLQTMIYCGVPAAVSAFRAAREVFKEMGID
jgi:4-carboxymuconolactone decarboxylase